MPFFGILLYLFFFFIRPQDWWGPVKGFPVDKVVVIMLILLCVIRDYKRVIEILKLPQTIFMLLFVVAVILSDISNNHVDDSLKYGSTYLDYTIIFVAIVLGIDSYKKLNYIGIYLLLIAIVIGYNCILQVATGTNLAGQTLYWGNRVRWVGLWDGANSLAMIFVAITPFILSFLFDSFGYSAKLLALAGAYFCIHGFYLTNSRGGFLGLIAVLFTYIYFKFKSKIGILAGVLLCIFLFFAAAPSRMHIIDDPQESTRGRIVAWYSALGMIRYHNPLFGVGKGQFIHYNRVIAHNAFVQQVGETGLVGAFFWLGFIYVTVKGIAEVFRKEGVEKSRRAIYRSYLIGLVGLLTVTMFISADHELWYVWMAFCSSIIVLEEVKVCFKLRDMFYIGLLEIMFILVVYGAVVVFENIYV